MTLVTRIKAPEAVLWTMPSNLSNKSMASLQRLTILTRELMALATDKALKAVANQPISVAIDTGGSEFRLYSSGVFRGEYGIELDHGVTIVGYGTSNDGTMYWLVINWWGTGWGEEGYIRMQRDVDAKEGLCGITMQASYPHCLEAQQYMY